MTPEETTIIESLREQGYAVVVFNPEELAGAPAHKVESRMCDAGWDIIDYLTDDDDDYLTDDDDYLTDDDDL